jgi:hypothetical protein
MRITRIVGVLLVLCCAAACQTHYASGQRKPCTLEPGMTTDALVRCGCMAAESRNAAAMMLMSEDALNNTKTIAIVNYVCPLGAARIARVAVMNGRAANIYE